MKNSILSRIQSFDYAIFYNQSHGRLQFGQALDWSEI